MEVVRPDNDDACKTCVHAAAVILNATDEPSDPDDDPLLEMHCLVNRGILGINKRITMTGNLFLLAGKTIQFTQDVTDTCLVRTKLLE